MLARLLAVLLALSPHLVHAQARPPSSILIDRAQAMCACLGETEPTTYVGESNGGWWATTTTSQGWFSLFFRPGVGVQLRLPDATFGYETRPPPVAELVPPLERFAHEAVRCFYQTAPS
jgi:hypothetical protein